MANQGVGHGFACRCFDSADCCIHGSLRFGFSVCFDPFCFVFTLTLSQFTESVHKYAKGLHRCLFTASPLFPMSTLCHSVCFPLYQKFHILVPPPFDHLAEYMWQFPSQMTSKLTTLLSLLSPESETPSTMMKSTLHIEEVIRIAWALQHQGAPSEDDEAAALVV